uniref:Esterase n=1 Tax=Ascaris suum TaxID=6253 RepID=F1LBY5_ASCSU
MGSTTPCRGSMRRYRCPTPEKDNEYLKDVIRAFDKLKNASDFNRVARKVRPVSASHDSIVVELTIEEEHVNSKKTLHGGQTAALVDMITARAAGITIKDRAMVSVELAVSYMYPVRLGETVLIEGKVLKVGRNMVFAEAEFRRKADGRLIAKGKHTIAFIPKPATFNGEPFEQF